MKSNFDHSLKRKINSSDSEPKEKKNKQNHQKSELVEEKKLLEDKKSKELEKEKNLNSIGESVREVWIVLNSSKSQVYGVFRHQLDAEMKKITKARKHPYDNIIMFGQFIQ